MKVLLADDDKNILECLEKLIDWEALNMEIVGSASNGLEMYNLAMSTVPDLIITDIKMPVMDGLEVCEKINAVMCDVKFIIISGYGNFSFAQKAIKFGVLDYIIKPIDDVKLEYLRNLLVSISSRKIFDGIFGNIMYDKSFQSEIISKLQQRETDFFDNLFDEICKQVENIGPSIKMLCIKLVELLYQYLEDIGLMGSVIESSRDKKNSNINEMKLKNEIINYTKSLYEKILFSDIDTNDYHVSLVESICKFIDNNFDDPGLNAIKIGKKFNFSSDYLTRVFKKITGISVSNYILNKQIDKAIDLLKTSDLSISDISVKIGYNDRNYFAKVFKKKTGFSPSGYKKQVSTHNLDIRGD